MNPPVIPVKLDVPLPAGLRWQRMTLADNARIYALHLTSLQGIASDIVRRETPDFFPAILQGDGEIAGVFHGTDIVAYTVLQRKLKPSDDPSPEWTPHPDQPLVKLAGSGVLQAWRGLGLQKAFIAQRVCMAGPQAQVFGTASPANLASWRNLLSCGFTLRAIKQMYGGATRFIGVREPEPSSIETLSPTVDDVEIDCFDIAGQLHLFQTGWHGVALGSAPNRIRYRQLHPSRVNA